MENITIGTPRGILYYKYKYLLTAFFRELNINLLVSPIFKEIDFKNNIFLSNYMKSIEYFIDRVNYILIIRICSDDMNYYFSSIYDIVNTKYDIKTIVLNMDNKTDEESAFIKLGEQLGFSKSYSLNIYKSAKLQEYKQRKINYLLDLKRLKKNKKKILLVGDEYIYNNPINNLVRDIFIENNIELINVNNINPDDYFDIKTYIEAIKNNINYLINYVDAVLYITNYPSIYNNLDLPEDKEKYQIQLDEIKNKTDLRLDIYKFIDKIKVERKHE